MENPQPTILIVDDDPAVVEALCLTLRRERYTLLTASDGIHALACIQAHQPDLVILDLQMPVMDGLEMLDSLPQVTPEPPSVVVLTGHGMEKDIGRCYKKGVHAFVRKPYNVYELKGIVRNTLTLRQTMNTLKETNRTVQCEKHQLEDILDEIPAYVWLKDKENQHVHMNRRLRDLHRQLGQTEAENVSSHPLWGERPIAEDQIVLETGEPVRNITQEFLSSEGLRCFRTDLIPKRDMEGNVTGLIGFAVDITEERELTSRIVSAEKHSALSVVLSGMAHQINNPLNVLALNLPVLRALWERVQEVLEKHRGETADLLVNNMPFAKLVDRVPGILKDMTASRERIAATLRDLMEYSQRRPGEHKVLVSLNEVVERSIHMTQSYINKHAGRLTTSCAPDLPAFKGDFQRLQQALINLLINACQALQESKGSIHVTTRHEPVTSVLLIEVSDEGEGIAGDMLQKIKDPFFTTRRAEGFSGLGLTVADRIVQDQGGSLRLQSTPGRGTVAVIELPATSPEHAESEVSP